jgi:hypothetical protein
VSKARAVSDEWLSFDRAVELIRRRLGISVGAAQARLRTAPGIRSRPSAEYIEAWRPDGGLRDFFPTGRPPREDELCFSKDDLLYWLDQQATPSIKQQNKAHRYRHAGDAPLVKKGLRFVKTGGLTPLAAAKKLAPLATGDTPEQIIERLRKLISDAVRSADAS